MKLNIFAIRCMMAENGMTIQALAKAVGTGEANVSNILRRGRCSVINAGKIAQALNARVSEIATE